MWKEQLYLVVLFVHRDFTQHKLLAEYLDPILKDLIRRNAFVEIYIGRNGEFDLYAASIVKHVQKAIGAENIELICVLPYHVKDVEYYEKYYDSVIIPECIAGIHPKGAIVKRNRWMVERADLLVCYAERKKGGVGSALRYARMLGKTIVNLAENSL